MLNVLWSGELKFFCRIESRLVTGIFGGSEMFNLNSVGILSIVNAMVKLKVLVVSICARRNEFKIRIRACNGAKVCHGGKIRDGNITRMLVVRQTRSFKRQRFNTVAATRENGWLVLAAGNRSKTR